MSEPSLRHPAAVAAVVSSPRFVPTATTGRCRDERTRPGRQEPIDAALNGVSGVFLFLPLFFSLRCFLFCLRSCLRTCLSDWLIHLVIPLFCFPRQRCVCSGQRDPPIVMVYTTDTWQPSSFLFLFPAHAWHWDPNLYHVAHVHILWARDRARLHRPNPTS